MWTDVSASARFTASRQTNGGQITRTTPATSVAAATSAASSAASSGVVFIFQFGATITGLAAVMVTVGSPRRANPLVSGDSADSTPGRPRPTGPPAGPGL